MAIKKGYHQPPPDKITAFLRPRGPARPGTRTRGPGPGARGLGPGGPGARGPGGPGDTGRERGPLAPHVPRRKARGPGPVPKA